jgi:hypothetical protein
MMGRQDRDQGQLFYEFSLDEMIPTDHLLRRINVFASAVLADLHQQLRASCDLLVDSGAATDVSALLGEPGKVLEDGRDEIPMHCVFRRQARGVQFEHIARLGGRLRP